MKSFVTSERVREFPNPIQWTKFFVELEVFKKEKERKRPYFHTGVIVSPLASY
jgi:hypothetical protein